jgi:hypothetical protein
MLAIGAWLDATLARATPVYASEAASLEEQSQGLKVIGGTVTMLLEHLPHGEQPRRSAGPCCFDEGLVVPVVGAKICASIRYADA